MYCRRCLKKPIEWYLLENGAIHGCCSEHVPPPFEKVCYLTPKGWFATVKQLSKQEAISLAKMMRALQ